jgi:hypothetical protein
LITAPHSVNTSDGSSTAMKARIDWLAATSSPFYS